MHQTQLTLPIAPPAPPTLPAVPRPPYTVALRDCPGLTAHQRMQAEMRFSAALERKLGTPEDVASIVRALLQAEQDGTPATDETRQLATRWRQAHMGARLAGLQDLAEITDAWFEIDIA